MRGLKGWLLFLAGLLAAYAVIQAATGCTYGGHAGLGGTGTFSCARR